MNSIPSSYPPSSSPLSASAAARKGLEKDDFLKLLAAQLQNQDPLEPMDNSAFMGQMAQFSALEQMSNVATAVDALRSELKAQQGQLLISQSAVLLGKEITTQIEGDSTSYQGVVENVTIQDGSIQLDIGDQLIDLSDVQSIKTSV